MKKYETSEFTKSTELIIASFPYVTKGDKNTEKNLIQVPFPNFW